MKNILMKEERSLFSDFDQLAEQFFGSCANGGPCFAANVQETEEAYVVSAAIPGVLRENIHVSVNGHLLRIRAGHDQSFELPLNIDVSKIEANFEDEVIEILLPKKQMTKNH